MNDIDVDVSEDDVYDEFYYDVADVDVDVDVDAHVHVHVHVRVLNPHYSLNMRFKKSSLLSLKVLHSFDV